MGISFQYEINIKVNSHNNEKSQVLERTRLVNLQLLTDFITQKIMK